MPANILVVDDDVASIAVLKKYLEESGHRVTAVFDAQGALDKIRHFKYDVMITDFNMPDKNGIELTGEVLTIESDIIVILVTAFSSKVIVVEAMTQGAFSYLAKPINKDDLNLAISRGMEKISIQNELILLKQKINETSTASTDKYDTSSPKVRLLIEEAAKVAKTDSSVLITGANGTGKEVLAKFIYNSSTRKSKDFVVLNCAAIPPLLLESELFGHVKGSFTGAIKDHKGYFEIANHGTIFLDEIGELEPMLQVKLLRVLQEKEFSRVGDTKIQATDVRIIAATNRDLKKAIFDGKFREDLFYRLNVFEFKLPSLIDRPEDIMYYFEKFVKEFAILNNKGEIVIEKETAESLMKYHWPGNIRELKNVAERVTVLSDKGAISKDLLPYSVIDSGIKIVFSNDYNERKQDVIHQFELEFLTKNLKSHHGNVEATAKAINFHPVSLRQKLSKLGINPKIYKN